MSTNALSPTPPASDIELQSFERLAVTLSSGLARLHIDAIRPAIGGALEQVARAVDVDASALIEFAERGTVSGTHTWPDGGTTLGPFGPRDCPPQWLLDRLARHEVLVISGVDDLPMEERAEARRTGPWSGLAVPVVITEQLACALIVWSRRSPRSWPGPVVERVRLVAEILGITLQRCRQDAALQASLIASERRTSNLSSDNVCLREEIKAYHDFDEIVGESAALRLALTRLNQVAPTSSSVLLLGETGTGKELFARALHDRSRRRARALVRVNCAALPPTLIESELFGHEKGAFTGAMSMRQGRFELADGGSIFLDEIGDLAPDIQAKLLRVLQEGEFERVGSSRTRRVDVRVIAATHRDLEADVASGRFRADLYYRLSVFPIRLPALRERREDIPRLVWLFIHRHKRDLGREITSVPLAVMQALQQYDWPGNIRELENVVESAMIQATGNALRLDDTLRRPTKRYGAADGFLGETLDAVQRAHIEAILLACGGRINGPNNAAERLGVHPNTLRFRMKRLGVARPAGPRAEAS